MSDLANDWKDFSDQTKVILTVAELDKIYARMMAMDERSQREHSLMRQEFTNALSQVKTDHNKKFDTLQKDVKEGFEKQEAKGNKSTQLIYTIIGGVVVGLILMVVTLASQQ